MPQTPTTTATARLPSADQLLDRSGADALAASLAREVTDISTVTPTTVRQISNDPLKIEITLDSVENTPAIDKSETAQSASNSASSTLQRPDLRVIMESNASTDSLNSRSDNSTSDLPNGKMRSDNLAPTVNLTIMVTSASSENVMAGMNDQCSDPVVSLFTETIKIKRDTFKKSTFAGVVSGSNLNTFRLQSAVQAEGKIPAKAPDDNSLGDKRGLGVKAHNGSDSSVVDDPLKQRVIKKRTPKSASHDPEDGNCGDIEDHVENKPARKKKAILSSEPPFPTNKNGKEASSQSSDAESDSAHLIDEKGLVGSPNSSLSNVSQVPDGSVDQHSQQSSAHNCENTQQHVDVEDKKTQSSQDLEETHKEGFSMFRKLRPKSAPTRTGSTRTKSADPKLFSIESRTSVDGSGDAPMSDFIHRIFHHHQEDAEGSKQDSSHEDDHPLFYKFFHHSSHEEETSKDSEHPHWFHIAKRQESLFAKFFHSRGSGSGGGGGGGGHEEEDSPLPSPALAPSMTPQETTSSDFQQTNLTARNAKSFSQPKSSGGSHASEADNDSEGPERQSHIFRNMKIGGKTSRGRPRSATEKSFSTDDAGNHDGNLFKNLMMPKNGRSIQSSVTSISPEKDATEATATTPDSEDSPESPKTKRRSVRESLARAAKPKTPKSPMSPSSPKEPSRVSSAVSLFDKYGKVDDFLGKGANATVRLAHKQDSTDNHEVYFAIKKFRKRHKKETEKEYIKKVIGEFCISSSLHHPNVIETVDLIQDNRHEWCVVMEYMPGGDLYARLQEGVDDLDELNCYFKQLLNGLAYIHNMGVAHRDLKPENLILDGECRILKIADFGVAEVFKTCFEQSSRKTTGVCGSEPYIAPEEWNEGAEFYATKVDVWACGIIYYALLKNSVPWHVAKAADLHYAEYIKKRKPQYDTGYIPFDRLNEGSRHLLYHILEPDPTNRWTVQNILEDPWLSKLEVCGVEKEQPKMVHSHKPVNSK